MAREDSLIWMVIDSLTKWLKTKNALVAIVGTLILLGGLAWLFSYQVQAFPAQDPYNVGPSSNVGTGPAGAEEETLSQSGTANEGQPTEEPFDLAGDRIWEMEVTFSARDEEASRPRFTNTPDDFTVTVNFPDGTSDERSALVTSTSDQTITFYWNWTEEGGMDWTEQGGNSITITVDCTNAGDQEPFFTLLHLRDIPDDGNLYSLSVFYVYTENE